MQPEVLAKINILIVEDNKINQLLVKNSLKKFGIENFSAFENGKNALKALSQKSFDLVLLDIQMPGYDGYEIAREIRAGKSTNRYIPIVALTADTSESGMQKAFDAGMNAYVKKPYIPEELYSTIVKCLAINQDPSIQ